MVGAVEGHFSESDGCREAAVAVERWWVVAVEEEGNEHAFGAETAEAAGTRRG